MKGLVRFLETVDPWLTGWLDGFAWGIGFSTIVACLFYLYLY